MQAHAEHPSADAAYGAARLAQLLARLAGVVADARLQLYLLCEELG
jgi:hypothetical protein